MADLAQRLRNATRASHQRLDRHPLLRALLDPPDTPTYAAALAALHGPLQHLEQAVAGCADDLATAYQPRCSWLEQDLRQLEQAPWPYRGPTIRIADRPALVGTLYVLEGARLGGHLIAARLAQTAPDLPCRFLAESSAPAWPSYWQALLDSVPTSDADAVISAAERAFDAYIRHVEGHAPTPPA